MKIEYFRDTDTLQITFNDKAVSDFEDLDENTLAEYDVDRKLVSLTIEHAESLTDVNQMLFQTLDKIA